MISNHLLCFGFGYVANFLVKELKISFDGTKSKPTEGFIEFNNNSTIDPYLINKASHILISIPPAHSEDIVLDKVGNILKQNTNLKWVGYLSSTSVYGHKNGEYVDENSLTTPETKIGIDRLKIEKKWLSQDLPIHIFRLAAIYGPNRSIIDRIQDNTARRIYKENHVFSRIYVKDIVNCLSLSMKQPKPYEIYNLADDNPSSQIEMIDYACKLMNVEPPILEHYDKAILSEMQKSFYQSYKRVSNAKIKSELGFTAKYPSYKEGIKDILNII